MPWDESVVRTAEVALRDFTRISKEYDFCEEGRRSFTAVFEEVESLGYDPRDSMCFVWYVAEAERDRSGDETS